MVRALPLDSAGTLPFLKAPEARREPQLGPENNSWGALKGVVSAEGASERVGFNVPTDTV